MEQPKTRREKEVWQACNDLWTEWGDVAKITGDALADRLLDLGYKKGSPNERYKYRKTWREHRGIDSLTVQDDAKHAKAHIERIVSLVDEELRAKAQAEIEAARLELQDKLDTLLHDNQALQTQLSDTQADRKNLLEQQRTLKQKYELTKKTLQEKTLAHLRLEERASVTTQSFSDHKRESENRAKEYNLTINANAKTFSDRLNEIERQHRQAFNALQKKLNGGNATIRKSITQGAR